jgi:YebC/PmpR family DNA-binding regulatory protein
MGRAYQNRKESMAKTAGAKTKVYSKYGKEIYLSAKNGGVDPSANLSLRRLMEKAKRDQVPTHVIERALEKASGVGGDAYSLVRYEGFGPGGCMVIVDCLTDNNNRTFGDVRLCFTKTKAKIGVSGSVAHMFDHLGVFAFKHDDEDAVLEMLLNADVDVTDVENEDGIITVYVPPSEFIKAQKTLTEAMPDLQFEMEEITFLPQTETAVTGDDVPLFQKFLDMLDELDDVQEVYHNAQVDS